MSTYENYNKTSYFFDQTRSAIGVEIIKNTLEKGQLSLGKQVLVDAGCGTGLYSEALIDDVKFIEAVDLNSEMIEIAKTRIKTKEKNLIIRFHQNSIHSLPLANESADAVMVNQVLHHLSDDASSIWKEHKKIFREFYRVLKPKGSLIINSCSPEQLRHGFWFYSLIPDALNAILRKTIDIDTLSLNLINTGFSNPKHIVPKHLILQGDAYFNSAGILDSVWRSGDSIWSLVTKETLKEVLQKVDSLRKKGELDNYMLNHDRKRLSCGQITFTITTKDCH